MLATDEPSTPDNAVVARRAGNAWLVVVPRGRLPRLPNPRATHRSPQRAPPRGATSDSTWITRQQHARKAGLRCGGHVLELQHRAERAKVRALRQETESAGKASDLLVDAFAKLVAANNENAEANFNRTGAAKPRGRVSGARSRAATRSACASSSRGRRRGRPGREVDRERRDTRAARAES